MEAIYVLQLKTTKQLTRCDKSNHTMYDIYNNNTSDIFSSYMDIIIL